jgi:quinol monooxygenase YgiN
LRSLRLGFEAHCEALPEALRGDSRSRPRERVGRRTVAPMSTQILVARIAGLAGRMAELRELVADRALAARAEPGCAGYEVAELIDEPGTLLVVQTWTSAEAMRVHFASDAHATYQHRIDELLARPSPSTSPTDPGRFG